MGDRIAVFNQGNIEQLGTPMELYHKPANHFVAGFLGSPKINLVSRPSAQNATPHSLWDQWSVYAAAGAHSVGLRPEHVQLAPSGHGIPAQLVLAEHLGDCTIAHLRVQGYDELVRAKLPFGHEDLTHGHFLGLVANFSHLLSFDEQGKRCN